MKNFASILLLLILTSPAFSQEIMTVREVFDYKIGDKLQTKGISDGQPPNANRLTILDKFYSIDEDTVYYVIYHDSYWTEIIYDDSPYLKYYFWTRTDTTAITNLDTYITDSFYWVPYDTSMYYYDTIVTYSISLCDSLINGYSYAEGDFEANSYTKKYGKGLGLVESTHHYNTAKSKYSIIDVLFYYEKNGIGCGTPDLTVAIKEKLSELQISVYPNPAIERFNIEYNLKEPLNLEIYNINGRLINKKTIHQKLTNYDCSSFLPGMYFLVFSTKTISCRKTLMIK